MPVAPAIARTKGRRRAGQGRDSIGEFGAAKRTLDAPEPSRRISRRSDGSRPPLRAVEDADNEHDIASNCLDDDVRQWAQDMLARAVELSRPAAVGKCE